PGCVKTCVGFRSLLCEPSPKSQEALKLSPSASVDLLVKATVRGAGPLLVLTRKSARGGGVSGEVVVVEDRRVVVVVSGGATFRMSSFGVDTARRASVTMRTMWNVPGPVKTCVGFTAVLFEPSPKSQEDLKESPSGSVDLFVKVTVRGAGPLLGAVRKSAIGGRFSRVVLVVEDGRRSEERGVGDEGGLREVASRLRQH